MLSSHNLVILFWFLLVIIFSNKLRTKFPIKEFVKNKSLIETGR